jgi:hypothetical protein
MFEKTGHLWFKFAGYGLLGIITLLMSFLLFKTVNAIRMQGICVDEG